MMHSLRPTYMDFESSWKKLDRSFRDLLRLDKNDGPYRKAITRDDWLQLFVDVYAITISTVDNMYEKLYTNIDTFLAGHVFDLSKELGCVAEDQILESYSSQWIHFVKGLDLIDRLFSNINKQYVKNPVARERIRSACTHGRINADNTVCDRKIWLTILELGLSHWRVYLLSKHGSHLITISLEMINRDRIKSQSGDKSDICAEHVKNFCDSLIRTQPTSSRRSDKTETYTEVFERELLEQLRHYYLLVSTSARMEDSTEALNYMESVETLLVAEKKRAEAFIHPSRCHDMEMYSRQCLLNDHLEAISVFLDKYFETENFKAIRLYHDLFKPLGNMKKLVAALSTYVYNKAKWNTFFCDAMTFVKSFVDIREIIRKTLIDTGLEDRVYVKAFDTALFRVINQKNTDETMASAPILLSIYVNKMIEKKSFNPSNPGDSLSHVLLLLSYISDKDLFYKVYLRQTAARLLYMQNCDNISFEQFMYGMLKPNGSCEFITRLNHMLTDFTTSDGLSKDFAKKSKQNNLKFKFSVSVFRTSAWPMVTESSTNDRALPCIEMETAINQFCEFYGLRHNGRKLRWLHHMSTVEVQMNTEKHSYLFTLTMTQFEILKTIDKLGETEVEHLKKTCDSISFSPALDSLVKYKLILVSSNGKARLNERFHHAKVKHNFTSYARCPEQFVNEEKKFMKSVDFDRDHYLQALIIRLLKTKKTISQNSLITEVIDQAKDRFSPDIDLIKRSINALIERDFVSQSNSQPYEYTYLA